MSVYYDEAKKTYYCKFSYVDWTGKTRWTTKRGFDGKKKAAKYEREFKQSAKDTSDITLKTLCDAYLADRKVHVRESTYLTKKRLCESYILPHMGNISIKSISPARVQKWQNMIINSKQDNGKPRRASTINNIVMQFKAMMEYATKFYGLQKNPFFVVDTIPNKQHEQTIWEESHLRTALEHIRKPQIICALLVLFYGGLRIGELKALETSDLDFDNNTIRIDKSMVAMTGKISPPKTPTSIRTISMPSYVMDRLHDYINHLSFTPSPLFSTSRQNIAKRLNNLSEKYGLPRIRVHDLRHSHASYLIDRGVPIAAISKRMGHKNPAVTLAIYSHRYSDNDKEIADIMDVSIKSWSKLGQ